LASGDAKQARARIHRAIALRPEPSLEAEANALLAECALVEGDRKEAARIYEEVSRRYDKRPAAETALFAAARTAQEGGDRARARELLARYIQRYPQGRFVKEAQRRLGQLKGEK
jgi:TolA-binding protein